MSLGALSAREWLLCEEQDRAMGTLSCPVPVCELGTMTFELKRVKICMAALEDV